MSILDKFSKKIKVYSNNEFLGRIFDDLYYKLGRHVTKEEVQLIKLADRESIPAIDALRDSGLLDHIVEIAARYDCCF